MVHLSLFFLIPFWSQKKVIFFLFEKKISPKPKTNHKNVNTFTNNVIKYLSKIYVVTSFPVKDHIFSLWIKQEYLCPGLQI